MAYERKTVDVWRIYVDYGFGWEYETCEYSAADAKKQVRCYRENCSYPVMMKKGREAK